MIPKIIQEYSTIPQYCSKQNIPLKDVSLDMLHWHTCRLWHCVHILHVRVDFHQWNSIVSAVTQLFDLTYICKRDWNYFLVTIPHKTWDVSIARTERSLLTFSRLCMWWSHDHHMISSTEDSTYGTGINSRNVYRGLDRPRPNAITYLDLWNHLRLLI